MNKTDLEKLVDIRIEESKILLNNKKSQGAYYLAGYALECAIKACISKQVKEFDFPNKKLAEKSHKHDLFDLIGVAGLKQKLNENEEQDQDFKLNWAVVKDWSVESRYDHNINQKKAEDIYNAITEENSGVLQWLKIHW